MAHYVGPPHTHQIPSTLPTLRTCSHLSHEAEAEATSKDLSVLAFSWHSPHLILYCYNNAKITWLFTKN